MGRLTNYVTQAGVCMTNLNSMKHYMPCITCRHQGTFLNGSFEKFTYCDTCEVKLLFNKLAHYEDLEETGRLIEVIRCKDCRHERYCKQAQYLGADGYCSKAEV